MQSWQRLCLLSRVRKSKIARRSVLLVLVQWLSVNWLSSRAQFSASAGAQYLQGLVRDPLRPYRWEMKMITRVTI
jgi:hypothetical protein